MRIKNKMSEERIPFNIPYMTHKELDYIAEAHENKQLSGDGLFTRRCHAWLEERHVHSKALLTHSCTAALEMAALLLDIKAGDEIIMPSYTFVSTANAFVMRGGVPVFVDIREDTLNINEQLIEAAITPRTKAIVPVHYAGVGCEMDTIMTLAEQYGVAVVEDAAQAIMAYYKGRPLGGIGDLGAYSFHETKNIILGEGGALLVNDSSLNLRAEIIREKGTDRSEFMRGKVDKYTWHDRGSSFLPGDIIAAFLWAQFERAQEITQQRLMLWDYYHEQLESLESAGLLKRPHVPPECEHNAHMYYIILPQGTNRPAVLEHLAFHNIFAISHYVPLHSSPGGLRFGRAHGDLFLTDTLSERIIRLPLWIGLTYVQQDRVIQQVSQALSKSSYGAYLSSM